MYNHLDWVIIMNIVNFDVNLNYLHLSIGRTMCFFLFFICFSRYVILIFLVLDKNAAIRTSDDEWLE